MSDDECLLKDKNVSENGEVTAEEAGNMFLKITPAIREKQEHMETLKVKS